MQSLYSVWLKRILRTFILYGNSVRNAASMLQRIFSTLKTNIGMVLCRSSATSSQSTGLFETPNIFIVIVSRNQRI